MFSSNMDSLGYQSFKGASWVLVLGLPLRDTIKGKLLVLGPFLILTFGLVSCSPVLEAFLPLQVCVSFFLESSPTSVQDCFRWSLISRLGLVSLVLFLALVHLFFSFVLLDSKSCEVLGRARLGHCISLDLSFFLA